MKEKELAELEAKLRAQEEELKEKFKARVEKLQNAFSVIEKERGAKFKGAKESAEEVALQAKK